MTLTLSSAATGRAIPLCRRGSGFDAAGLDYLIGKRTEYYDRRQRDRTLKKGDRVAILGRGIAVVEHADDTEVQALLRNRIMVRMRRNEIVRNQRNMRWEADGNAAFECLVQPIQCLFIQELILPRSFVIRNRHRTSSLMKLKSASDLYSAFVVLLCACFTRRTY